MTDRGGEKRRSFITLSLLSFEFFLTATDATSQDDYAFSENTAEAQKRPPI